MEINFKGFKLEIEVDSYRKGRAAYIFGAPEDCYEAEDSEIDFSITSIEIDDYDTVQEMLFDGLVVDCYELEALVLEEYESTYFDEY